MHDVLAIGTATRDVFLRSPLFKIVRDPKHLEKLGFPTGEAQCFALGGKIEVEELVATVGGGAANAAVTFARQGFRAAASVAIGNDIPGRVVQEELKREKIKVFPARHKEKGTAFSNILLSPTGERTILNYRGASANLSLRDIPASALGARWAYVTPGHIPFIEIKKIVEALARKKVKIAMNPSQYYVQMGMKKLAPIFRHLALILVNREEAAALTHMRYEDERGIFKKFDEVVKGIAVMTEGPKGVLVSDGARIYRAGIFRDQHVVDRTGAGDAFGSGFVAGLMRKHPTSRISHPTTDTIQYAIRLGSANATSVVEKIGAQPGILSRTAFDRSARWQRLSIKEIPLAAR